MAKIHGIRSIVVGVVALAMSACVFETTSEKREFGKDGESEQCSPAGREACGSFNCGTVPDGCGGDVVCGPLYARDPNDDYPYVDPYGDGCTQTLPYTWRCGVIGQGGPAPRSACAKWSSASSTWCCATNT